ncbi:MAG: hypothetical protein HYT72_04645 [Candidatus Aenigmarchaeota archaeon]|nr:hypothetical protein [Candidatus Aenigmarchaeota archaeon]
MPSDASVAVELYQSLKRRYQEAGLPTNYLEATAGVELFNTDAVWEPHEIRIRGDGSVRVLERMRMLEPDIPYVLSSLAKAEDELNRHLSGRPSQHREEYEKTVRRFLIGCLTRQLKDRITQQGYNLTQ